MEYKVIWHDCEDERTGSGFGAFGQNPTEAYFQAIDTIKNLSPYLKEHFCSIDLECLVDETGKYHYPDIFLAEKNKPENKARHSNAFISGPSCVGKNPLINIVKNHFNLDFQDIPLIRSKESRIGGPRNEEERAKWSNPNYFMASGEIEKLKDSRYFIVEDVRGFPQAINLMKIIDLKNKVLFSDVYYKFASKLKNNQYLEDNKIGFLGIFISPVSKAELNSWATEGKNLEEEIRKIMTEKLDKRGFKEDNASRAKDAGVELREAWKYDGIIVNPYGEDHEYFKTNAYPVIAIAGKLYDTIRNGSCDKLEHWDNSLLG